jgi:dTDP-4-amino-4,6-dideoxygalactose transaminase
MLLVSEPVLGAEEKAALAAVIESGWVTMGDRVREFEQTFARMHEAEDSIAVGSCTAALHLILHSLGIGPGDEVLVPSLTFVATANSVLSRKSFARDVCAIGPSACWQPRESPDALPGSSIRRTTQHFRCC